MKLPREDLDNPQRVSATEKQLGHIPFIGGTTLFRNIGCCEAMPHYLAIFEYRERKVAHIEVTDDVVGYLRMMNGNYDVDPDGCPISLVQAFPYRTRPEALEALATLVSSATIGGSLKGKATSLINTYHRVVEREDDGLRDNLLCISDNTSPAKESTHDE